MDDYKYNISSVYVAQIPEDEQEQVTTTSYTYTSDSSDDSGHWQGNTTTGDVIWVTDHTTAVPNSIDAGVPGNWQDHVVSIPSVWTDENMGGEWYPKLPNSLGVIYVDDGEIRCRTPEGEDLLLGKMKEGEDEVSINIIATIAKRLLEKNEEVV